VRLVIRESRELRSRLRGKALWGRETMTTGLDEQLLLDFFLTVSRF
jgi:hypothetical protein